MLAEGFRGTLEWGWTKGHLNLLDYVRRKTTKNPNLVLYRGLFPMSDAELEREIKRVSESESDYFKCLQLLSKH